MSVRADLPLELAMTHRVGPDGVMRACARPAPVLEMATRMHKWKDKPEDCRSCQSLPAVSLLAGEPICARCRDQREQRMVGSATRFNPRTRQADDQQHGLAGHAIVFDSDSVDLGGFTERIRSSAVDRTLAEKLDLRALWNHDSNEPLARKSAGTLDYWKAKGGLAIDIQPSRSAAGRVESIERRDVQGMSFAFQALEDDWHLERGEPVREVIDMLVSEVSPVTFPAYPGTDIRVVSSGRRGVWDHDLSRARLAR